MRKFTFIKSLMLVCMLMVGMGVWAESVTSTFTNNQWAVGAGEQAWAKTGANAASFESASPSRGVQTMLTNIKSSGLSLKNTTIKNLGNITGVSLVVSSNGTGGSISSVKVGSTNLKCNGNDSYTVTKTNGQTASFTTSTGVSGDIVITFASSATDKSLYVKSITVTYEPSDKTALGTPANLTSSNVTDRSATLSWDAVANADSYVVKIGDTEYNASTNSFNATGLDYSTEYTWSVKALSGDSEDYSDGAFSGSSNFTTLDFTVQAGTYNVLPNDVFWGKEGQNGTKNITANTSFGPVTGYGITFAMNSGKSTNSYFKEDHCRAYDGYTLTITAPTGYNLTAINFTGSTWAAPTASVGTMSSKSWTGSANEVTFTFSGTSYMSKIQLTYAETATITLNSLCTDGAGKYYGTYSNTSAWVVPAELTVSEIDINGEGKLNVVSYATGAVVPANTGVMVSATKGGDYTVVLSNDAGTHPAGVTNALHPSSEAMTGENLFYRLTMHNGTTIGFAWGAADGGAFSLGANKAYLAVAKSAGVKSLMWTDNNETAIQSVEAKAENKAVFNLAGQRVNKAMKGIYIVNGKKVVK